MISSGRPSDIDTSSSPFAQTSDRRSQLLSSLLPAPPSQGEGHRARLVPLRILVTLGWVLTAGQAAALLIVFFRSGGHPRLALAAAMIAAFAGAVLSLAQVWHRGRRDRAWLTDREAGGLLAGAMILISLFFAATGGILNPFVILLLAPISVSATTLSARATGVLVLLAIVLLGGLTMVYMDLPWRNRTGALDALILPLDYRAATWAALVVSLVFLTLFISWQAELTQRTRRALEATRLALEREQRLANLGGLAAAAAHELGTPLATVAVVARDMADMLADQNADPRLIDDAQLLMGEAARCRDILARLATPGQADQHAGEHEAFLRLTLEALVSRLAETHGRPSIGFVLTLTGNPELKPPPPPHQGELLHGLGNIVQNAFQFAQSQVTVTLHWDAQRVSLCIQDDGPGYPASVLDRLGEPYVRDGRGGQATRASMGLGLFIATSLLRHAGGETRFQNRSDGQTGAEVFVSWALPISEP